MDKDQRLFEMFGVSAEDLRKITAAALSAGGDYADLYFEHSAANELSLRDGEVNNAGIHTDYGMGVRVLSGERTGYAYTEITTMADMLRAAERASKIASGGIKCDIPLNITKIKNPSYYPITRPWESIAISYRIPYLQKLNELVFIKDNRVSKVLARISDSSTDILFFNSFGEIFTDSRPMASITATCIMEQNGRSENASASRSFRMGAEFLTEELINELASEVVKNTAFQFEAIRPKGGEMPVVMGSGSSGILLHEAIGHAFEADFNRQRISIFSDMLGKKICNENISVVDDGTIKWNRGSVNIDDEGIPGQKTYMVKDGILNSYLHDRISAKYYGTQPTGNGRRESFRYMPLPRMRATYMENGNCKEEDMIRSVKKGIYVDNFSNGQVQIGAGDFTFFVKSGWLIEDGKLTAPVKDVNIIGNGPEALAGITAVADNFRIDNGTWTCGKEQYCPVSCGMPSVLVQALTVGGV
jgi:TldD protein